MMGREGEVSWNVDLSQPAMSSHGKSTKHFTDYRWWGKLSKIYDSADVSTAARNINKTIIMTYMLCVCVCVYAGHINETWSLKFNISKFQSAEELQTLSFRCGSIRCSLQHRHECLKLWKYLCFGCLIYLRNRNSFAFYEMRLTFLALARCCWTDPAMATTQLAKCHKAMP